MPSRWSQSASSNEPSPYFHRHREIQDSPYAQRGGTPPRELGRGSPYRHNKSQSQREGSPYRSRSSSQIRRPTHRDSPPRQQTYAGTYAPSQRENSSSRYTTAQAASPPSSPITQVSRNDPKPALQLCASGGKEFAPQEPDPRTFTPLLPAKERRFAHKNTLVLDLDETLVHSSFKPVTLADILVDVELDGHTHTVFVKQRPYVEQFLARMAQLYEVVVLTASLEVYADPVLDELDREGKWIHHRLFRDSCANLNGNYIKDLSYLGRNLSQVIIIDNSPTSYLFQPRNALPISSWFDDPTDHELRDLIPVLEEAAASDNVYPPLERFRQSMANQDADMY